jgi:hypothetical protein
MSFFGNFLTNPRDFHKSALKFHEILWEKVRTTKITMSKTKKNIEKVGDDHYIEKIYKSDQKIEIQKDQNIESDLPMAFCLLNLT